MQEPLVEAAQSVTNLQISQQLQTLMEMFTASQKANKEVQEMFTAFQKENKEAQEKNMEIIVGLQKRVAELEIQLGSQSAIYMRENSKVEMVARQTARLATQVGQVQLSANAQQGKRESELSWAEATAKGSGCISGGSSKKLRTETSA